MNILGIDYGLKNVGFAIGEQVTNNCSTFFSEKYKNKKELIKKIKHLICEWDIKTIVIGLPLNMDGSEGPKCQSTRDFAKNFSNIVNLPITFWDERLTTVAAERSLLLADLSRKKRKQVVDSVAAVLILQNLLDRLKNIQQNNI